MKNKIKIGIIGALVYAGASYLALAELGRRCEWGPFFYYAFRKKEREIVKRYDSRQRHGEIVFYGASNFRRWETMEEDMAPFAVQNHGFGGSTDRELVRSARKLLYPYDPAIIVLQTGSNDCARMFCPGNRLFERVLSRKINMLETFHKALPNARIVVLSGILMPGRRQYDGIIKRINRSVKGYAAQTDYIYYVDAEAMTVNAEGNHLKELFVEDGVHLTDEARIIWAEQYIKPALDRIVNDSPELRHLKRDKK